MLNEHYPVNEIGQRKTIQVPVSFETAGIGTYKIPTLPYRSKLISAKSAVTAAIAASNDATITIKKSSTTIATITVAASSALGDEDTAPAVTEVILDTDAQYTITTAKSSAGGTAMLFLTVEVLPSH